HAGHAEQVAADGGGGMRQALERLDEADRGRQVQQHDEVHAHFTAPAVFFSFFRNISSIRRVTRKPPKMLTAARATASTPMVRPAQVSVCAAASMAPTMTIAEMAL